jgi:hypothetical protein
LHAEGACVLVLPLHRPDDLPISQEEGQVMRVKSVVFAAALAACSTVHANDLRTGVGGALGGAGGAAIGDHVGGSTGAIVGGAVGGAAGGAVGATGKARTGAMVGGAIGGGAGAAIGNEVGGSTGAIVGAGVGGAAGAVVGGAITADSKPKSSGAPQALQTTGAPTYTSASCNRNNPGKGRALGHCKH